MYLDLLCDNNYINVNIKFMKLVGIETAVYFAEILNIIREVVRKKKFNEQGFFKLDRKYIESRTTLDAEAQYDCDVVLTKLLVLSADPANLDMVRVDLEEFAKILVDDNMKGISAEKKKLKVNANDRAEQKRAGIAATFRKIITEQYDLGEELTQAFCDWSDTIITTVKRPLNKVILDTFINKVLQYSDNLAERLDVISTATVSGWNNADWAISGIRRNRPAMINPVAEQKISQGFAKEAF